MKVTSKRVVLMLVGLWSVAPAAWARSLPRLSEEKGSATWDEGSVPGGLPLLHGSGLAVLPPPSPPPPPPPSPPAPTPPVVEVIPPLPEALAMPEIARYQIRHSLLGEVGALSLEVGTPEAGAPRAFQVRAVGAGEGAIFGLGHMRKSVSTEFDVTRLSPAGWVTSRWRDGEEIIDRVKLQADGAWAMERQRTGRAPETQSASFAWPTLDPMALVLRLRVAPPPERQSQVLYLLDGRQLWRLTVHNVAAHGLAPEGVNVRSALRLQCRAEPIFWDGRPDGERPTRDFTLWLADDVTRLPLRLEMPIGFGTVVVGLAELRRGSAAARPVGVRLPLVGGGPTAGRDQPVGVAAAGEPAGARNL